MKKLALCGLLLTACAFAQVSYDDLKTQIHTGSSPEAIKEAIRLEGVNFEVDLELLRAMKADRMPDWLIDFLINYDEGSYISRSNAPRRGATTAYYDNDLFFDSTFYWGLSPWSCVNWYYYFCDPWGFHRFYGPSYFYGFYGFAPWFTYYPYGYVTNYRYHRRGTVSPRGYRAGERRIVGRAVPRNSSTASRTTIVSSRSGSAGTRSAVSSRSRGTRIGKPTKSTASRSPSSSSNRSRSHATSSRSSSSSRATASRSRSSSRSSASRASRSSSRSSSSSSRSRGN